MPGFPISSDFSLNEVFIVANSEYEEKGTAHHHKSSSDDFYTKGLSEIITRVFVIDKWINNKFLKRFHLLIKKYTMVGKGVENEKLISCSISSDYSLCL